MRIDVGRAQRTLVSAGVLACMMVLPGDARAQGVAATCVKVLWQYVGKPVSQGMLSRGGELLADYFAEKIRGDSVDVSERDIQVLRREFEQRGMTDCDLRQQLQAMYSAPDPPTYNRPSYSPYDQPYREPYAPPYDSPYPSPQDSPYGQPYPPVYSGQPYGSPYPATACVTQFGACPMAVQLPVGSSCVCYTQMGQLPGIAQ